MIHFILKQMLRYVRWVTVLNCLFPSIDYKRESRVISSDEDTYNYKYVRWAESPQKGSQ